MIEIRITEKQGDKSETAKTGKILLAYEEDYVTVTIEKAQGSTSITVDRREFLAAVSSIIRL